MVHAQFETIHPFTDGNGRVGRALIHTVLARRGITTTAVLPVSLVLATLRETYVQGLSQFRYDGPAAGTAATIDVREWIEIFTEASRLAAEQSAQLVSQITSLQEDWQIRLSEYRAAKGIRETPRANSATARLLTMLPEAPVATVSTLRRILGVSAPAAGAALDELHQAGVLETKSIERGTTAYLALEILDLITYAERQLASTRFDTRTSTPNRAVPARPQTFQEEGNTTND